MLKLHLLFTILCAAVAEAQWTFGPRPGRHQVLSVPPHQPGYKGIYNATFEQLIDHSNPSLGTFSQTYWYDYTQWKGPGSPILLISPSEANGSEFISLMQAQVSIIGVLAKKVSGAVVLIEHRYWGNSSPYPVLSTENMQYLTLENSVQDLVYFADNVDLPFAAAGSSNADSAPWVLIGGSYSGALTAWTAALAPGTYWAYLATSAVVQALGNFWQFYQQIADGMPKNCSTDVGRVVEHMDSILTSGSSKEQHNIKAMFGLEELENTDAMYALTQGPALWQNPPNIPDGFYEFCDYVENSVNQTNKSKLPGASGVGLTKALEGYSKWMKTVWNPTYCFDTFQYEVFNTTGNVQCYNSYNASSPLFTDMTVSNTADRQWEWYLCNQPFGWWQNGDSSKLSPRIASSLLTDDYWTRQCGLYFPDGPQGQTYGIAKGVTYADQNAYSGGWYIDNTTRLIYTNGQYDPWRDVTVSSYYRPGGPLASTEQVPVHIVPEGNHCSDLFIANGESNPGCKAIQEEEYSQLITWIKEFTPLTEEKNKKQGRFVRREF